MYRLLLHPLRSWTALFWYGIVETAWIDSRTFSSRYRATTGWIDSLKPELKRNLMEVGGHEEHCYEPSQLRTLTSRVTVLPTFCFP